MQRFDLKSYLLLSSNSLFRILRLSPKMHFIPSLVIYPTNACNYDCIMCDSGKSSGNKDVMPIELMTRILDETKKLLIKPKIHFSGLGEPLVYTKIVETMEYCRVNNIKWSMTTNGFLLQKYATNIVSCNCNGINVSIHGLSDVHEGITQVKGSFDKVISGINAIDSLKISLGKTNPNISINCVVTSMNLDTLYETGLQLCKLPISSITFQHLIFDKSDIPDIGKDKRGNGVEVEKLGSTITRLQALAAVKKINIFPSLKANDLHRYYTDPDFGSNNFCVLPWLNARIYPNGDVGTCGIVYGNVADDTISNIVNSKSAIAFRRSLMRGKFDSDSCFRCCHKRYSY